MGTSLVLVGLDFNVLRLLLYNFYASGLRLLFSFSHVLCVYRVHRYFNNFMRMRNCFLPKYVLSLLCFGVFFIGKREIPCSEFKNAMTT